MILAVISLYANVNVCLSTHLHTQQQARQPNAKTKMPKAANTSWRSPVWASAPFGLRRGAGANTVGVVVVVALVVVAHFAPATSHKNNQVNSLYMYS